MSELKEVYEVQRERFSSDRGYFDYLMYQIQSHLVDINELQSENDPYLAKKVADLALFSKLLALHQGYSDDKLNDRAVEMRSQILKV